jgi:predicted dienelactone hydrolase
LQIWTAAVAWATSAPDPVEWRSDVEYDPFVRGPFPVGVRSGELIDTRRDGRRLPFEIWYPAAARYGGLDQSPITEDRFHVLADSVALSQAAVRDASVETGDRPLVVFSHTSLGHRRQSSFLCTHLASHGYVVAAPDHTGNTFGDLAERAARGTSLADEAREAYIRRIIADRVPDLRLVVDEVLAGSAGDVSRVVDDERLGLVGWSFGGWAVLSAPEVDDRWSAVVAIAPAGNSQPLPGIIPATLSFAWTRDVPTLILAAERDQATPLPGIYELFERTPSARRLFILGHADHDHFGDHIGTELCPRHHAHLFTRGLAVAHLDAALKQETAARAFLAGDPAAELRERGVAAVEYRDTRDATAAPR